MTPARRLFALVNLAHFLDHYLLLILPTAVIAMPAEFGADFAQRLSLGIWMTLAFGFGHLPWGWLADRMPRVWLLRLFLFGSGAAAILVALAPDRFMLAAAATLLGAALAIYHTIGTPLVMATMGRNGRFFGINGMWGNGGVASAALGTAALMAAGSWRTSFIVPGLLALLLGVVSLLVADPEEHTNEAEGSFVVTATTDRGTWRAYLVLALSALMGGLLFQAFTFALPKLLSELTDARADRLVGVGALVAAATIVGALSQFSIGRLAERFPSGRLFQILNLLMVLGMAMVATGQVLLGVAGVALAMIALFGMFTVEDGMLMTVVPPLWRSRATALVSVASFCTAGAALPLVAWSRQASGDFHLLALILAGIAAVIFLAGLFLPPRLTGPAGILRHVAPAPLTDAVKDAT